MFNLIQSEENLASQSAVKKGRNNMNKKKQPDMRRVAFSAFKRVGFSRREAATMVQASEGHLRNAVREATAYISAQAKPQYGAPVFARR